VAGAAVADGTVMANSAKHAAAATVRQRVEGFK
jgi:hypothetical protein